MNTSTPVLTENTNGTHKSVELPDALRQALEQVSTGARADVAFATPRVIGEHTLIPVAHVTCGFAGGAGGGMAAAKSSKPTKAPGDTAGSGGGGVGGFRVRPFASIDVSPQGVRVIPLVDVHSIVTRALGIAALGMLIAILARWPRARRGMNIRVGRMFCPNVRVHNSMALAKWRRFVPR
jgi:uncharacterized spore protein YtfJ